MGGDSHKAIYIVQYTRICMERVYAGRIWEFGGFHAEYREKSINSGKWYRTNPIHEYATTQIYSCQLYSIQKESLSANSIEPIVTANDLRHSI